MATQVYFFFGAEDHDHLLAFHQRVLLDDAYAPAVGLNPSQKLSADVLEYHLSAAEPQGYLGLVTLGEEADRLRSLIW